MTDVSFKSSRGKLTDAQKKRLRASRKWVEDNEPRLTREALKAKAERMVIIKAFAELKRMREERGLSLADVAERSGIDKSRLSKLENDPYPNPTFNTLMRIADALGVALSINVIDKEAA
jgi:DNA-binding Xre family transcriptional regulator